jgi:hypothetical protein
MLMLVNEGCVSWLQVMSSQHTVVYPSTVQEVDGMEISQTSLELEATSGVFREGKLRVRCLATIFTLYRRSEELELTEDTPQLAPVMGPTAPHSLGKVLFSLLSVTQVFNFLYEGSLQSSWTHLITPSR